MLAIGVTDLWPQIKANHLKRVKSLCPVTTHIAFQTQRLQLLTHNYEECTETAARM